MRTSDERTAAFRSKPFSSRTGDKTITMEAIEHTIESENQDSCKTSTVRCDSDLKHASLAR